jgi:hypothetical protein
MYLCVRGAPSPLPVIGRGHFGFGFPISERCTQHSVLRAQLYDCNHYTRSNTMTVLNGDLLLLAWCLYALYVCVRAGRT